MPASGKRRETAEAKKKRAAQVLSRLKREFPEATTALAHGDAFQLLIATILSAQCTDERVNKVTPALFERYRTAADVASARSEELESIIRSTGFFRAKARNIIGCSKVITERFRGRVPDTMEELVELPGVGRKTANVILGNYFGKIEGIVVDTHVGRLAQRLGFSAVSDPERIETDLMEVIPRKDWITTGNVLILHGRKTCVARKPRCEMCSLKDLCPSSTA